MLGLETGIHERRERGSCRSLTSRPSAWYLGHCGFKCQLGDRISCGFCVSPQSLPVNTIIITCLKLGHDHILPNSRFVIEPIIEHYIAWATDNVKTNNSDGKVLSGTYCVSRPEQVWISGGKAPLFLCLGTRWMWVVSFTPRPLYSREKFSGTHRIGCWVDPIVGLDAETN